MKLVASIGNVTHELVHAIDDCESGHGAAFRRIALDIGLEGRMPEAKAGRQLRQRLHWIADVLGPIPHQKLQVAQRHRR